MKITVSQLRRIIREEVERELNTGKCPKCGTSVQLTSGGLVTYHDYKNPLGDTQNCPGSQMKPVKESKGFNDYIRKLTERQLRRIIREELVRESVEGPSKATLWDPIHGPAPVSVHGVGKKLGTVSGKEREVPSSSVKFDRGIDSEKYGIPYEDPHARALALSIVEEYPEEEIVKFLTSPEPEGLGFLSDNVVGDLKDFLASLRMNELITLEALLHDKKYGIPYEDPYAHLT